MQGRTRHRAGLPGMVAKLACKLFNRFSSVATACGMQCLVDLVGALQWRRRRRRRRRALRREGVFYRLAGAQANLIDDVSGQIPPYDQFITLGPVKVKETVEAVERDPGCRAPWWTSTTSVESGVTSSSWARRRRRRGHTPRRAPG